MPFESICYGETVIFCCLRVENFESKQKVRLFTGGSSGEIITLAL